MKSRWLLSRKGYILLTLWQPEIYQMRSMSYRAWGANQMWYRDRWQREAGCGPTTCANLIWYLARTHEAYRDLWPDEGNHWSNILRLMEELWRYITPTHMGVHRTSLFADGAARFGLDRSIPLRTDILDVPPNLHRKPNPDRVKAYLSDAFSQNLPVAFLNLDRGSLHNLESWHWVTLISVDERTMKCHMIDQGRRILINLGQWLDTTGSGGGFVVLY